MTRELYFNISEMKLSITSLYIISEALSMPPFRLKTAMWLIALFQRNWSTNRRSFNPWLKNPRTYYSRRRKQLFDPVFVVWTGFDWFELVWTGCLNAEQFAGRPTTLSLAELKLLAQVVCFALPLKHHLLKRKGNIQWGAYFCQTLLAWVKFISYLIIPHITSIKQLIKHYLHWNEKNIKSGL